jgi:methionyl-tRNA formyltransferase
MYRVLVMATGEIAVPMLRDLLAGSHEVVAVVTQPDKPVGRKQEVVAGPVKRCAEAAGVPVLQPRRLRDEGVVEQLRLFGADVFVVMAYGQILSRAVLDLPRVACLNLHASLLPRHRGAAPIQAAIDAGDTHTGVDVMYMDEGLDTGDVLLSARVEILPDETGGMLHDRLGALAPGVLAEALRRLEGGGAPREPQDGALATYARKLEREDGWIDWGRGAEAVARRIRAYEPWPGSFFWMPDGFGGLSKCKVFDVSLGGETDRARSGEIVLLEGDAIGVASVGGVVLIRGMQVEGKRRMTVREYLAGNRLRLGTRLDGRP